ncbi:MAG: cytochrome C [Burkholderiales bacterium]
MLIQAPFFALRPIALRLLFAALFAFWLQLGVGPAAAQGIETIMSPGKLAKAHAKWEEDCAQCHVRFDRQAQDKRCLDCHKETRADVQNHTGLHGKMKPQACRTCHAEHQGVDAKLVTLDKTQFDHKTTTFALNGKHQKTECDKCHVAGKKFRETPDTCQGCHRKDDVHKGALGNACADCHTEVSWKEAKFDHEKTKFSLTGKHVDVKCAECHKDAVYKDTPKACIGCHRKIDEQKGHKGQFGEKCETCHTTKAWKPSQFNHDVDTKYLLKGKHVQAKCVSCHTGKLFGTKLAQDCFACHGKDDKHKDSLGHECQNCHTEKAWKEQAKFDHSKSEFPLAGKHAQAKCTACHEGVMFKSASKECYSCHKKEDKHEASLGTQCGDCHTDLGWKLPHTRFDHAKTRFVLRNLHDEKKIACKTCHADLKSFRNTALECYACHKKDDKHEGQLGQKCEQCHSDRGWKGERFDHNKARFVLTGGHALTACKSCHLTPRFRDAKRDCFSCHQKTDKHKLAFGVACESCHNARAWPLWSYDHDKRTRYPLEGAHAKVACARCHTEPAPEGKAAAALQTTCYSCHRGHDTHEGRFGLRCEQCHSSSSWKKIKGRGGVDGG